MGVTHSPAENPSQHIPTEHNHRRFGLEWTSKIIYFQPLCHEQGCQPPYQAAQGPIQPGLNTSRDGASTPSVGSPCQGLTALSVIKQQSPSMQVSHL